MPSLPGNNAGNEGFQPSEGRDALPPKNSEGNPAHRRKGACW